MTAAELLRLARVEAEREILTARIADAGDEIHHIGIEIARLKGSTAPRKPPQVKRRAGAPKSLRTLQSELTALISRRAWLHAKWLKLRGVKPDNRFAPIKPKSSKPGRPHKSPIGEALRFWVSVIQARYRVDGKELTIRAAGKIAEKIIKQSDPKRKGFTFREEDYYAELRKKRKVRSR
jgi:hypothetical protein